MHVKELDSISLVKLCAQDKDDHAAWQEFFSRFLRKIRIYLLRSCKQARRKSAYLSSQIALLPAQELDDLVQQVLMRMIEKDCLLLKRFNGKTEEDFCAYLDVLARSEARNHYRDLRRKKRPEIECSLDNLTAARINWLPGALVSARTANAVEESFLSKEIIKRLYARRRVRHTSLQDSERVAHILDLYFLQGFTEDEISRHKDINLSQQSVSKLILTFKRDLKKYVGVNGY